VAELEAQTEAWVKEQREAAAGRRGMRGEDEALLRTENLKDEVAQLRRSVVLVVDGVL
jgi:hypothetical protein